MLVEITDAAKELFDTISYVASTFSFIVTPIVLLIVWYIVDKLVIRVCAGLFKAANHRVDSKQPPIDDITKKAAVSRISTMRQIVTRGARCLLTLIMLFWILSSIGIDLRPIIAGVGVIGLALSLAAQSIIKDVLNGFLILFEDQFNVGDWIEIGSSSGTVDEMTLRATRLRDLEGNLVIIPNGSIETIINYTKDWAVALIKFGISYESDYVKARKIALDLAESMAKDTANVVLDKPSFHGITDFGDNAVEMRVLIKTAPGLQWNLGRQYREKLKELFDAEGIFFAYPQVVVHEGPQAP